MKTLESKLFLKQVGKVVHYLNTIVVGLSAVESGNVNKPDAIDISWHPADVVASSRQARAFVMRSTLVTVAEELSNYVSSIILLLACLGITCQGDSRSDKLDALRTYFSLKEDHLFLGPLLVIHWRNRIVHANSKANLTKSQRTILIEESPLVKDKYKNLDPILLLEHFDKNTPTLKDVSSLVAMTMNFVRSIDQAIPTPTSKSDVMKWIKHLGLERELDRVKRVSKNKGKVKQGVEVFFDTHCPSLKEVYFQYCDDDF